MAKQIIISKGDYGFCFNIKLISEDGKPIPIGNDKVSFYITKPNKKKVNVKEENIRIVDNQNGEIEFTTELEHTNEVGNHNIYVELSNSDFEVNTVNAVSYYVIDKHGGV